MAFSDGQLIRDGVKVVCLAQHCEFALTNSLECKNGYLTLQET